MLHLPQPLEFGLMSSLFINCQLSREVLKEMTLSYVGIKVRVSKSVAELCYRPFNF